MFNQLKLQNRRSAYGGDSLVNVGDPGELNHEPVSAPAEDPALLELHHRLADAKGVDAPLDNLLQGRERLLGIGDGDFRRVDSVLEVRTAREVEPELKVEAPRMAGCRVYKKADRYRGKDDDYRPVPYGEHVLKTNKRTAEPQLYYLRLRDSAGTNSSYSPSV